MPECDVVFRLWSSKTYVFSSIGMVQDVSLHCGSYPQHFSVDIRFSDSFTCDNQICYRCISLQGERIMFSKTNQDMYGHMPLFPVSLRFVQFFHYDYFGITIPAYKIQNETMQACAVQANSWLKVDLFKFVAVLQAVYTLILAIIPNSVLLISEILLIIALAKSKRRRESLSSNSSKTENREQRLTIATAFIVFLTLMYGIVVVVTQTFNFLYLFFKKVVMDNNDIRSLVSITNTIFWLMTPSNFVIICCLSQDFRTGFKTLFRSSITSSETTPAANPENDGKRSIYYVN